MKNRMTDWMFNKKVGRRIAFGGTAVAVLLTIGAIGSALEGDPEVEVSDPLPTAPIEVEADGGIGDGADAPEVTEAPAPTTTEAPAPTTTEAPEPAFNQVRWMLASESLTDDLAMYATDFADDIGRADSPTEITLICMDQLALESGLVAEAESVRDMAPEGSIQWEISNEIALAIDDRIDALIACSVGDIDGFVRSSERFIAHVDTATILLETLTGSRGA